MGTFYPHHTFHIPVMGIGYTIDSPIKVAPYGIASVVSLVDDILMEKMREFYCKMFNRPFEPISALEKDYRARRITEYLNLLDSAVKEKFEGMKNSFQEKKSEISRYIDMLPDMSSIKKDFTALIQNNTRIQDIKSWIQNNLSVGAIDVNIMTKLDKENYSKGEKLGDEYNDAHAAIRGFANSSLNSSVVLSAGMNPKLYGYIENFEDFYPDENFSLKKSIILKVSDYRSALIQGKFLAKKGLWVSEYRVESGLNCGGHAFASDGMLMGPILEEFSTSREELINSTHELYIQALKMKNRIAPTSPLHVKITAQGGVGTAEEHRFLINHYKLDSVGWGSPFLLVKEATSMDSHTRDSLANAKESDLYLSNISPLGVPFNSLRNNTKDNEKIKRIEQGKPGSNCPKHYSSLNTEFTERPICTASRQYQQAKINELKSKNLPQEEYLLDYSKIVEKSCICVGLGTGVLIDNKLDFRVEGPGVSVCPGPNMAYFSRQVSLSSMVDHIYGRANLMDRTDRPNMFIKEISLYIDYLKTRFLEMPKPLSIKDNKYIQTFKSNIEEGIEYYKALFSSLSGDSMGNKETLQEELLGLRQKLGAALEP
ncbi:MAG: hypothetical protein AB7S54_01020 [Bacteroidales bacterium]